MNGAMSFPTRRVVSEVIVFALVSACGGRTDPGHDDPHGHGHDDLAHLAHGHLGDRPDPTSPVPFGAPYVYPAEPHPTPLSPTPSTPEASNVASPSGPPAPSREAFMGASFSIETDAGTERLAISEASVATRGAGPQASWDCSPDAGTASVTDFALDADPARAGKVFVVRIDRTSPNPVAANSPSDARITLRRAGEPRPTYFRGTMTWAPDWRSGTASAWVEGRPSLIVRWTCDPRR